MKHTMKQRIADMEARNAFLESEMIWHKGIIEILSKKATTIAMGWSRVHVDDLVFMRQFEKKNKDRHLFDVFNHLLYSHTRPDANGVMRTRLSSICHGPIAG